MIAPFLVLGLPRSRTAWLSRFLSYGDWKCGHDELRHARSLDDASTWFSQPCIGSVETAAAPWWRLLDHVAPGARVAVVRRPVSEVVDSIMRVMGDAMDRAALTTAMAYLDRKLDQIEARLPDVLSVNFHDLGDERVCALLFEHCLPLRHDHAHWAALADENIQIDLPAMMRYAQAYRPALDKLAATATHRVRVGLTATEPVAPDGITFQVDTFDAWERDAPPLFENHCVLVGEPPENWKTKNIPLMRKIYDLDAMQIMTARSNGRMFGYLMTLITPSLVNEERVSATHTTFYADPSFPGLGMKLQRAALAELKARGVDDVVFEAGHRGSGPRLGVLYKRLGAQDHGQVYRLQLTEV